MDRKTCRFAGSFAKRLMGFEAATFCMASRTRLAGCGANCLQTRPFQRSSLTGLVFEMSSIDGGLRTE